MLGTSSNLLKNESELNEFLNSAFQYKLKSNPPQPQTKNHVADSSNFENDMKFMKDEISKLILKATGTDLQSNLSLLTQDAQFQVCYIVDISCENLATGYQVMPKK